METVKKITEIEEIYQHQRMQGSLFSLDLFNPQFAVFPRHVFSTKFDAYRFLHFNDWFDRQDDFDYLIEFIELAGESEFFAACPPFCLLSPVKFSVDCSHSEFVKGFTYNWDAHSEHPANGIGLRMSPQTFMYGTNQAWAMVNDLTHDIVIVGLKTSVQTAFESAFSGKYFTIQGVVQKLEEFQGAAMDNAEQCIQAYS
jgi:hypothetical protein